MARELGYTDRQRREACEWLISLRDSHELPDETLQDWNLWFSASEGNRNAFKAVERAYHHAALSLAAPLLNKSRQDDYDASISVEQWRSREKPTALPPPQHISTQRWKYAAAAALATVAIGAFTVTRLWNDAPVSSGDFTTKVGEHMELSLADGSRVSLGGRSRLRVNFTAAAREIRLESGEAFFSVHKDPQRPFSVAALDGVIVAIGTAFNVRATDDRVTVAVTEGLVRIAESPSAIAPQRPDGAETLQVSAGQQTSFTQGDKQGTAPARSITPIQAADATRWRDGWLVYRNEPLRYVVADIARYSDVPLDISASLADELRFTGAIYKDNVAEWLLALPEIFPVDVHSDGRRLTIESRSMARTAFKQTTM